MAAKAGVWIDHKQAVVVLVTGANREIKKVAFEIGQPVRSTSGARPKRSQTPNDFVAEDKLQRKVENDRKSFYDEVIASIAGADSALVLGPGEAKGEFVRQLKSKKLRGLAIEVETADKMTDGQLAAKVGEHFAKAPVRKSAAPKKKAKAKPAKPTRKAAKK